MIQISRIYIFALSISIGAIFSGCYSMQSTIQIESTPEKVWKVLIDLDEYQYWNPFILKAHGIFKKGESLNLMIQPVEKSSQDFSPVVMEVKEDTTIVWRGRLLVPGLFNGVHRLTITKIDDRHVLFTQSEDFSGILVPFVGFTPYYEGWKKMNEALKRKVESEN